MPTSVFIKERICVITENEDVNTSSIMNILLLKLYVVARGFELFNNISSLSPEFGLKVFFSSLNVQIYSVFLCSPHKFIFITIMISLARNKHAPNFEMIFPQKADNKPSYLAFIFRKQNHKFSTG